MNIPELNYNEKTLPRSILKYFYSLGYCAKCDYNDDMLMPPFRDKVVLKDSGKTYEYYPLERHYHAFLLQLEDGLIHDKEGHILERWDNEDKPIKHSAKCFMVSFAKGFQKGYVDYTNTLQKSEIFAATDEKIAYQIFERVCVLDYPRDGKISALLSSFPMSEYDSKDDDIKVYHYITKELFFERGVEAGEYYRAWELVFSNPKLFEKHFNLNKPVAKKTFPDYLLHKNPIEFAEKLKVSFNTGKGKPMKLLLEALERLNLIEIPERQFQNLYDNMKLFFDRDIGTYQSVNDYKYERIPDEKSLKIIQQKLVNISQEVEKL